MDFLKKVFKVIVELLGKSGKDSKVGKNSGDRDKKIIENLVIILIIGIIAIVAGGYFFKGQSKTVDGVKVTSPENEAGRKVFKPSAGDDQLEEKMGEILSQIKGAGNVKVMITYNCSREAVPYSDIRKSEKITQEKDEKGGTRNNTDSDYENKVIYEDQGGSKKPFIAKEIMPEVKGVVVVADGAGDPVVRERLSNAVKALLDVPIHRIQVFEKRKGGK